ncbi:hypothetical protein VDG1235_3278 [Verrucomicrobiia bacterium DG1235]|nr:hypothetical protein VDG1235_3278 [Verrucomicrobiae bacterium DG1235]
MITFWKALDSEFDAGRPVFLAFVAKCSKGSPGTPQARLLVRQDGSQLGTIGGGVMEKRLIDFAVEALRRPDAAITLQHLSHQKNATKPSGLICGGSQSNILLTLKPTHHAEIVKEILAALESSRSASIRITPEGLELVDSPLDSAPQTTFLEDESGWKFQLNLVNQRRVAIFGAGHCGQALSEQMHRLGYHVTLVDQRSDLELPDRIRSITTVMQAGAEDACRKLHHWDRTAVVVMTHSYPTDLSALEAILPHQPTFLGLMGSPSKLKRIFGELRESGISKKQIAQIRAPVGLAIGSDTPEEIAVSIAAQLLQEHHANAIHEPDFADHIAS